MDLFGFFFDFFDFLTCFEIFVDLKKKNVLVFWGLLSKLQMLLLKFTKVSTGHQKFPKKRGPKQHNKLFFAWRAKKASAEGQSHPQELEGGPSSGPYLLVILTRGTEVTKVTVLKVVTLATVLTLLTVVTALRVWHFFVNNKYRSDSKIGWDRSYSSAVVQSYDNEDMATLILSVVKQQFKKKTITKISVTLLLK